MANIEPATTVPVDVYAFGNAHEPRPPRITDLKPGQLPDLPVDAEGMVDPAAGEPCGASTFGDPSMAPLSGHYHRLPAQTQLPDGLGIIADGVDVGGNLPPTHYTLVPTRRMTPEEYLQLYRRLPWHYAGKRT
jgi:hypothetical protein